MSMEIATRKNSEAEKHGVPGGYHIQFSDDAIKQMEELSSDLQQRVHLKLEAASATGPDRHGTTQGGIRDRLLMLDSGIAILVWVSRGVRVLTVVDVRYAEGRQEG